METVEGQSINGRDDYWEVGCPNYSRMFVYMGFFCPDEIVLCPCGTRFKTSKVWLRVMNG